MPKVKDGELGFADLLLAGFNKKMQQIDELEKTATDFSIPTTKLGSHISQQELVRRVVIMEVDPELCEPWSYHNRNINMLNSDSCKDVISSISAIGQQIPILLREAKPGSDHKYDIIYGVRRWFACKQLNNQKVLAQITQANDRDCMILMHRENVDRKDISDFERACSFKQQFNTGVFTSQSDFAQAMNLPRSTLTKLLTAADLIEHTWSNEFITDYSQVQLIKAYKIASLLKNTTSYELVEKELNKLRKLINSGQKKLSTAQFIEYLLNILLNKSEKQGVIDELINKNSFIKAFIDPRNNLTIKLLPTSDVEIVKHAILEVIDAYYSKK